MGLLRKLFNDASNGAGPGTPRMIELLDEELYWKIIGESIRSADDVDEQEEYLRERLQKLAPVEIIGFRLRTDELLAESYTSELWCAAYIINGGCSDDGFDYFRCWLISRGKDVYERAKANPDSLADVVGGEEDKHEFESLAYVPDEALEEKTGKDLEEYLASTRSLLPERTFPSIELSWDEEDPASMQAICPRLYEKYLNN